ncbi:serine/threonine-protein phosphatase 1 regulatory subunit 10-like [Metopolophium dirhodum]|uniref:serine/threonine-protein phosphatase 1 regulatory subunit 10-like n=1 Tax=Metopolophium dirhodum TaxID=44670 RepID=UPI0029905FC1|nr:serine/threonine-protein phosphatase 1 regulatory subunit 10-like [Metopolophium dirhodum]
MPPIDPMQLLNCLKVLLNEESGGLKGPPEAMQISRLMAKFSKKIVSKSLYVFILKESTPHLLNIFMDAGGWNLIYNWLKDAVETDNIILIQDLLTIFHIVPVTMERLKANGGPKLVKKLSKTHIDIEVKSLAQQLVEKWLKVVKTEQWHSMMSDKESLTKHDTSDNLKSEAGGNLIASAPIIDTGVSTDSINDSTTSDCKTKIDKPKNKCENEKVKDKTKKEKNILNMKVDLDKNKEKPKPEKEKVKDDSDDAKEKKRRIKEKNGNPFLRIIGEMTDEKSDEDKQIENDTSNLTKLTSRRKQNLKNLASAERLIKLKLSNDSKKSSDPNSSADIKKESRPLPPPVSKPKLPESKTILEKKNYSIHVEKKEYVGEKKPTVKTFKSKFRSTGLEEQAPPPPHPKSKTQSKKSTKSLSPLPLSKAEKRSLSPPSDSLSEKKLKSSPSDTKKLPPKIKESGLFMDAMLNVLNSAPKVTKKRKPKPDVVKKDQDSPPSSIPLSPVKPDLSSPPRSPVHSPSTLDLDSLVLPQPMANAADESPSFSESVTPSDYVPLSAENTASHDVTPDPEPELNVEPIVEKPPQLKFYRDTLLDSTNESLNTDEPEKKIQVKSPIDESTTNNSNDDKSGMRSVLVYVRNKSSKKSVSWKQENDLVKVSYFEHDETERVNVTKNFKAMEMHERDVERQNFIAVRKLNAADNMESKTPWRYLDDSLLVDLPEELGKEKMEHGSGSQEKKKQTLREQSVLQAIYFTRNMVPDSPEEPDQMEIVPYSEPLNIPLEDMSGDTAPIYNYVSISWPESKGDQPPIVEFPIGMNNIMPMPNMMIPQPQFPVFGGNQMNWGMPPENMMGMGPPANNMYIPPNQMMMNNQMFMGDQMPQQPQPLSLQQQPPPPPLQQQHPPVQEDQWMGPTGPPMQHDQHWGQQQPPPNNGPPHFERGGGARGHTRWDNPRGGNYDSYRGKINRNNQRGNRGGPYNRRGGHPGNGRVGGRLCKYYAKQGFCKTSNCAFLHSKC